MKTTNNVLGTFVLFVSTALTAQVTERFTPHIKQYYHQDSITVNCLIDTFAMKVQIIIKNNTKKSFLLFDSSHFDLLIQPKDKRMILWDKKFNYSDEDHYGKVANKDFILYPGASFIRIFEEEVVYENLSCNVTLKYLDMPFMIEDKRGKYYNILKEIDIYFDNFTTDL